MNNIRLVEERRRTACMVREGIDWMYCFIGGVIFAALALAAPLVRVWASTGWGL